MLLAGVDVGSTGLKVALYQLDGRRVGYAYREYSISYGPNGQATLDPSVWWISLCDCLQELSNSIDLRQVAALGISSANAMILTDRSLAPVFPAIMQLDKRGAEMVPLVSRELGDEWLFAATGNRNAAGYQWGPTLKWLQRHEPAGLASARYLLNPGSYLAARLTGVYGMDVTRAATTLLFCSKERTWSQSLWTYFGLSQAEMPPIFRPYDPIGVTGEHTPLPAGIPVAAGGIDTVCAMLGLTGGQPADGLILGSVGRFAAAVSRWDSRFLNTFSWDGNTKLSMTPVNNCGTALKWIRNVLSCGAALSYDQLNAQAKTIPPGSDGLRFYPFLNGASCPHWDETVRGTFLGLEAYHTSAHFIRAVMEGVAFSLGENQNYLSQCGGDCTSPLYLGGGGANSPIWAQIFSNVLGRTLILPEETETETMGSAILAGMAIGTFSPNGSICWNHKQSEVQPDDSRGHYQTLLAQFCDTYAGLASLYQTGH